MVKTQVYLKICALLRIAVETYVNSICEKIIYATATLLKLSNYVKDPRAEKQNVDRKLPTQQFCETFLHQMKA